MQVGQRIREIRLQKGFSLRDLERVSGMRPGYVSRVEHGHTTPSVETLQRFASVLDVPMYVLFLEPQDALPPGRAAISSSSIRIEGPEEDAAFLAQMWGLAKGMNEADRRLISSIALRLATNRRPESCPTSLKSPRRSAQSLGVFAETIDCAWVFRLRQFGLLLEPGQAECAGPLVRQTDRKAAGPGPGSRRGRIRGYRR
jgi:transcriptional regulator with XRE-family HTH domain